MSKVYLFNSLSSYNSIFAVIAAYEKARNNSEEKTCILDLNITRSEVALISGKLSPEIGNYISQYYPNIDLDGLKQNKYSFKVDTHTTAIDLYIKTSTDKSIKDKIEDIVYDVINILKSEYDTIIVISKNNYYDKIAEISDKIILTVNNITSTEIKSAIDFIRHIPHDKLENRIKFIIYKNANISEGVNKLIISNAQKYSSEIIKVDEMPDIISKIEWFQDYSALHDINLNIID